MLWRAGNAPNQMADTVKVESPLYFSLNQVANKSRLASSLGRSTAPEGFSLFCGKADSQSGFHEINVTRCKTECKTMVKGAEQFNDWRSVRLADMGADSRRAV